MDKIIKINWFFSLKSVGETLPGDVLLVTAFISYVGCFNKRYRIDLMEKNWIPFIQTVQVIKKIFGQKNLKKITSIRFLNKIHRVC